MDPLDYVEIIDDRYEEAKKDGISRMDIKWGMWSADMNRELRKLTEDEGNPNQLIYKYVFVYWILKSQLLELYYQRKGKSKIKQKVRELREIKKVVNLDIRPPMDFSKEDILRKVLSMS